MEPGKTRFDRIISLMKKNRLESAPEKPSGHDSSVKNKVDGFKSLRKKEGKKNLRKNSRISRKLQEELDSSKDALLQLASHAEEEASVFAVRFKPRLLSDHLYADHYQKQLQQLAWYYRRIGAGLVKQDLDTLERCFESVREARKSLEQLEVLLVHVADPDPFTDRLKKCLLNEFNGAGSPDEIAEVMNEAEKYAEGLIAENNAQFALIPDNKKNEGVIEAFEIIQNSAGDYLKGLQLIKKWLNEKNSGDLSEGLKMTKAAGCRINRILDR